MKKAIVTGAAGFIGSHLVEELLATGWHVTAVDNFSDWYPVPARRQLIREWGMNHRFEFLEIDLRHDVLDDALLEADVVFHLAARPGVRTSWDGFDEYIQSNLKATQLILDSLVKHPGTRLVFASSSSIYGNAAAYPTTEETRPQPISPYGVTKVACEQLVEAYRLERGVDGRSLRYFTVYGPRQRPDMAFHRWIRNALSETEIVMYGDGSTIRDFTYVSDVARATIAAIDVPAGEVVNVCGGEPATLKQVLNLIESEVDQQLRIRSEPRPPGDVHRTGGSSERLRTLTGWTPKWSLKDGIANEVEWLKKSMHSMESS